MIKTSLTLLFCTVFGFCSAQDGKLYRGSIANAKVTLYLQGLSDGTYADEISGVYQYDGKTRYILLKGFRNHDGNLTLTEFPAVNFSGIFLGTIFKNNVSGKWMSADRKRALSFSLNAVNATKEQLKTFQKALEEKRSEFAGF